MTHKTATLLATLVTLLFSGCATAPTKDIEFKAEADPKVRFEGYKSFAWLAEAAVLHDPEGRWEPPTFDVDAEVKFAIDRELRKRGLTQDSVAPDLYVAFGMGVDMEAMELKTDPQTKMDIVSRVPRGGLLIALTDADTGFLAWLGVATGELQENPDKELIKARIDYAVTKLLKTVPK